MKVLHAHLVNEIAQPVDIDRNLLVINRSNPIFFDLNQVIFTARKLLSTMKVVPMSNDTEFKEVFNGWYFGGGLVVLLALPLMHILAGWYVFFFSN